MELREISFRYVRGELYVRIALSPEPDSTVVAIEKDKFLSVWVPTDCDRVNLPPDGSRADGRVASVSLMKRPDWRSLDPDLEVEPKTMNEAIAYHVAYKAGNAKDLCNFVLTPLVGFECRNAGNQVIKNGRTSAHGLPSS